jgi:hypothetical protein
MTPADLARKNAISLEAKKDALSQRQSGDWKVSFTVQGIDMDTRLTQAPMGTRYAVVLVEIGDDEQPVQKEAAAKPRQNSPPNSHSDGAKREKMDWREVQPAAQAGIRCADPVFISFLKEQQPNAWRAHQDAASLVRWICGVKSRSELGTNHLARVMWKTLDDQFQVWLAKERVGA